MIYLLTAIGLTPGGSSTAHIYTQQYTERQKQQQYIEQHKKQYIEQHKIVWNSAGRAPSCQVIPWHLPYN
jgi:hypothetical protein